ncbi:hypothetical protein C0J52_12257 [Blattella germanica]|nr:hypothetical protein C0J52_12257 [Blattella germanica]
MEIRPVFSKYCFASTRKLNLEIASHVFQSPYLQNMDKKTLEKLPNQSGLRKVATTRYITREQKGRSSGGSPTALLLGAVGGLSPSLRKKHKSSLYKVWMVIMQELTERVLGPDNNVRVNDHWFDKECELVTQEKNKAYQRMLQKGCTRKTREE